MDRISFTPLAQTHLPLLHQWMQQRHVSEWWGEEKSWSLKDIEEKYSSYLLGYKTSQGSKRSISAYIIEYQSAPIGYLQMYNAFDFPREELDLKAIWPHPSSSLAAVDFYLGAADGLGKGLGAESLKSFLSTHVFPRFNACLVDPDKKNKDAIKTYAKAGFSTVHENDNSILMMARKEETIHPIVILGSSRTEGNTLQAIKAVIKDEPIPIVDLRELAMSYYDYTYANARDDFIPLAVKMVRYNPIILATPVYWYSMSAIMKTFIDRWTDLIYHRKDIGRRLTNKELYVVASYGDSVLPRGFEDAFSQTCDYLEMKYRGCYYYHSGDNAELKDKNTALASQFFENLMQYQKAT